MSVQRTVQNIRIQGWINQVKECEQSGLSVRQWCEANGVSTKTYYFHRKRVREELLSNMESGLSTKMYSILPKQKENPVFAALPVMPRNRTAINVIIGAYTAEIQNGADIDTVEGVLRTLIRL